MAANLGQSGVVVTSRPTASTTAFDRVYKLICVWSDINCLARNI